MRRQRRQTSALALAVRSDDWELVALLLLAGVVETLRTLPPGTIDDVLALLDGEEARRGDNG